MLTNNSKILQFFSQYPNQPFEFVIVTDINIQQHPNYYKAIFRNIKTNTPYSVPVTPEMMRYKYKVGHIYTDGEHVGQNKNLSKDEFLVNINSDIELKRISSIISDSDAELLSYEGVKKYFLRH